MPLFEPSGIEGFFRREVLPQAKDAWVAAGSTKLGYEISLAHDSHLHVTIQTETVSIQPETVSIPPETVTTRPETVSIQEENITIIQETNSILLETITIQPETISPAEPTTPSWKQWEGQLAGGEFPLEQFLAAGENGAVFRTRLTSGDGAIKLVPAERLQAAALVERWNRASALKNPHLIKIVQTGTWVKAGISLAYAVMEYADENLETVLMERPLTDGETREMLLPVAEALASLHDRGLVHGRLRPSNIFAVKDTLKISSDGVSVGDGSVDSLALASIVVQALTQQVVTFAEGDTHAGLVESLPQAFQEIVRHCLGQDGRVQWSAAKLASSLRTPQRAVAPVTTSAVALRPMRVYRYKRKTSRLTHYTIAFALIAAVVVTVGGLWRNRTPDSMPAAVQSSGKPLEPPAAASPVQPAPKPEAVAAATVKTPARVREPRPPKVVEAPEGVVREVLPIIPSDARRTIHGKVPVTVRVAVDQSGEVTNASVQSGNSQYLGILALEAARRWHFAAADSPAPREWSLRFEITRADTKVFPKKSAERANSAAATELPPQQ